MDAYTYPEERAELIAELEAERIHSAMLAENCDEMCGRLLRLEDHLRTLAKYASAEGYDESGPPDPFPEPVETKTAKTKKRAKA